MQAASENPDTSSLHRKPLMQEAAAGGSQIHFTPALAFVCPITTPSRMPMVTTVAK
jgi:hypothetical protein